MTPRYAGESQRQYVERVLRSDGRVATYDVLYSLAYEDGRKCSITRLAAIVFDLRRDGWAIDTEDEHASLAAYVLAAAPQSHAAPRSAPIPSQVPAWVAGWRCTGCGGRPASQPEPMLGGLAGAFCAACGARRYFRAVA